MVGFIHTGRQPADKTVTGFKRMRRFRLLACVSALWAAAALATPTPQEAAACVAALQARAAPLAQRLRDRDTTVEAQLLPVVTVSFAFVGSVYKQSTLRAEADALLNAD